MTKFAFDYRFHPAGQGVFASGTVTDSTSQSPFHWVFDCGSLSLKGVLEPRIISYRNLVAQNYLDLLCISHFDYDHVSGLSELLRGLSVGTVVIPYISKLERLVIGSKQSSEDPDYWLFLGNPVAYLLGKAESIKRIIIIGSSPEEPEQFFSDRPPSPDEGRNNEDRKEEAKPKWQFTPNDVDNNASIAGVLTKETIALAEKLNTEIQRISYPFRCLAIHQSVSAWEFLFFHKPIKPSVVSAIRNGFKSLIINISGNVPSDDITTILSDKKNRKLIRETYNAALKLGVHKSEDINSTSLCLYSGPVLDDLAECAISGACPSVLPVPPVFYPFGLKWEEIWLQSNSCSILYTGDANLKISQNRVELIDFINQTVPPQLSLNSAPHKTPANRWEHILILQVPHHGSRNNWEVGASGFGQQFSVFCADDLHRKFKHPHPEVVLDLLSRGPVLTNKTMGWQWHGYAGFR